MTSFAHLGWAGAVDIADEVKRQFFCYQHWNTFDQFVLEVSLLQVLFASWVQGKFVLTVRGQQDKVDNPVFDCRPGMARLQRQLQQHLLVIDDRMLMTVLTCLNVNHTGQPGRCQLQADHIH